jgi:hypothetical protein
MVMFEWSTVTDIKPENSYFRSLVYLRRQACDLKSQRS